MLILFKIFISWLSALITFFTFIRSVSDISDNELYKKPELLSSLFSIFNFNLSEKVLILSGTVTHHLVTLLFVMIYHILWFNEFKEISWIITISIGVFISMMLFLVWTLIIHVLPRQSLINFKGHYLQIVFFCNFFTMLMVGTYMTFIDK